MLAITVTVEPVSAISYSCWNSRCKAELLHRLEYRRKAVATDVASIHVVIPNGEIGTVCSNGIVQTERQHIDGAELNPPVVNAARNKKWSCATSPRTEKSVPGIVVLPKL